MRYNAIRAVGTVIAVSAAWLGGQTLSTMPVAQAAGGVCAFAFNKEPYLLHEAVVVGGTVKCDPAPIEFHLVLQLWHRSSASNPTPKGEPAVVTQIPNPQRHVAAMALDCVPGVWQGKIVMRATWKTGTDEARKETAPTFIQC
ncbi:hypothetical protein IU470_06910 [Nocardia abscessus]|uniref:Lipoprotein n=1 Tax=Nocardia abscessus TaxID=120957 RepID=A0ABS0C5Q8_9NOCA|nr:hypothetical protein [Nocardia abscessus]MBF6224838.1 hypothetical protein [Nocardia abscessus]